MSDFAKLKDYLSECKLKVQTHSKCPVTVVLGNSSADLDSVVSSVTFAYAKHINNQANADEFVIPVINIPKNDFRLRTDIVMLLQRYDVLESMLVFLDDVDLNLYKNNNLLSLCLVDHNVLDQKQTELNNCVVEVIDHHIDENVFPLLQTSKTIAHVGSCCTLVTEKVLEMKRNAIKLYPVADLLLAAIAVDTVNFNTEADRSSARDVSAATILRTYANSNSDDLYKMSEKAKFDVSNLSLCDMLRKDTKQFKTDDSETILIASVTTNPLNFVEKVNGIDEFKESCRTVYPSYELFVVMFIHYDSENIAQRDIIIHSYNETLINTIDQWLQTFSTSHHKYNRFNGHPWCKASDLLWYKCEDNRCSRKIFMPLLKEFFYKRCSTDESVASSYHTCLSQSISQHITSESTCCDSFVTAADDTLVLEDSPFVSSTPNKADESNNVNQSYISNNSHNLTLRMDSITSNESGNHERIVSVGESSTPGYDDNDSLCSNRLFSVDDQWDECGTDIGHHRHTTLVTVPSITNEEPRHKIFLKELSFDDVELKGTHLLAPVFLAIAEDDGENDDDGIMQNLRPKAQSIENLCFSVSPEGDKLPKFIQRRRTKSELPPSRHRYSSKSNADNDVGIDMIPLKLQRKSMMLSAAETLSEIPVTNKTNNSDGIMAVKRQDSGINSSDEILAEDEPNHDDEPLCSTLGKSVNSFTSPTPGLWNRYLLVSVADEMKTIDLFLIEPYVKVVSHGGYSYQENEKSVVMVFSAAYLPPKTLPNYDIVMQQLFYYVVHVLTLSVVEDYVIVYFNSGATHTNIPRRAWLKQCYLAMDRRLKKNLQRLYIVHSNFWLKALIRFHVPFISSKFTRKIQFIKTLADLGTYVPTEYIYIPDIVASTDAAIR